MSVATKACQHLVQLSHTRIFHHHKEIKTSDRVKISEAHVYTNRYRYFYGYIYIYIWVYVCAFTFITRSYSLRVQIWKGLDNSFKSYLCRPPSDVELILVTSRLVRDDHRLVRGVIREREYYCWGCFFKWKVQLMFAKAIDAYNGAHL